ncbi:ribosome biogenesis GTPase A [Companilactobacillus sp. RD055328]|uniref:ribosome biogenesis GTPase YlqF n=1 Tax=Companilactobacillus sp. RD055328 TaxID=2916634 RepID=UPI001FC85EA9|nr:ribosome biogenesis GTPase YlqF [Companilactobacillus sp. RD055328]GKQ42721.1 ribosome biogenesis GTPase A [Companilactobacillus sp. RD055328]
MAFHWYPGHMNKAKNQVQDRLKLVDVVIEIVDARLPLSSRNPMLDSITNNKKRVIILNKSDLADPKASTVWRDYFEEHGISAYIVDSKHANNMNNLINSIKKEVAQKVEKYQNAGVKNYKIKAMCIGIPNVGKSTILNRFAGKNIAVTGNKPGVTKNQNWIKTKYDVDIIDTPGILWPKIEDEKVGLKLALTGAIKDSVFHADDVALFAIDYFKKYYPEKLIKAYKVTEEDLELENPELLLLMTKKMGMRDDFDRMSEKIMMDVRKGTLGAYTLDQIDEAENAID